MRWIYLLAALFVAFAIAYSMYFVERSFNEIDGAKVGMHLDQAIEGLDEGGWSVTRYNGCSGTSLLVMPRRPDHNLLLTTNDECEVTEIRRKPRQLEL